MKNITWIIVGLLLISNLVTVLVITTSDKSDSNENEPYIEIKPYYNQATGELYPILTYINTGGVVTNKDNPAIHTCVWTFIGDHGSSITVTTENITNPAHYLDVNSDPWIKSNKFLPPKAPIYVTCIDWGNQSYKGFIAPVDYGTPKYTNEPEDY